MSSPSTPTAKTGQQTDFETISCCRNCGGESLANLLDFGAHPLANALQEDQGEEARRYPLSLAFCRGCSLVQIRETVRKDLLFSNYFWVTGTSATTRRFARQFYENTQKTRKLEPGDLVVEVASNDGTFLRPFLDAGHRAIGVDSAANIAEMANARGIPTTAAFWNRQVAERIVSHQGQAKLIFARNVIPHASELHEVVRGMQLCLAGDGLGAIEFHYAGNILEGLQYDSIYHEHLCYFSIRSIESLLNRFDLHLFHIDLSPISGGACVVYFSRQERDPTDEYTSLVERERRLRVNELETWESFASSCSRHRERSREILRQYAGRKVVGFGASARSSTYLNFCNFSSAELAAIIDNNELKHGRYTPGSHIPIIPMEAGLSLNPDLLLVLAWNFKDEIMAACRQKGYRGSFLIPFPEEPYFVEPRGKDD